MQTVQVVVDSDDISKWGVYGVEIDRQLVSAEIIYIIDIKLL